MHIRVSRVLLVVTGPVLVLVCGGCPQGALPGGEKADDLRLSPPRIDAVTPDRGPAGGSTQVTIRGGPFESQIGVLFGANAAVNPVIVNAHMITAMTPPHAPGVVDVTVLSNGGQTTVLGAFTYEGVDIISISPTSGSVAGGSAVTISGNNFSPSTVVKFGGQIAGSVVVLNPQLITAVTPPHAAGWVSVEVLSDGTRDSLDPLTDPKNPTDRLEGFRYIVPNVRVDSIEPAFGPIEGGTQVTIRGALFPDGVGVLFGGAAATHVTRIADGFLTAIVPPAAGEGPVDVTIVYPGGQVVVPGGFRYTTGGPLFDDGTDTDGDGLTDVQEMTGWEVWIDTFGQALGRDTFFNILHYPVTSDPDNADTDGDGLTDDVELRIRSDPRLVDSDMDGLHDAEEWNQWLTSPTSVDTDGDSRGDPTSQLAPNQALFDGLELFDPTVLNLPQGDPNRIVKVRATSPTLSDTDGDGASDFDEFDSTVRNGVLSDLPRLDYRLVGDVDVQLNVEYAETIGETHEYGVTLTESRTETIGSEFSNTIGWSLEVGIEQEVNFSPFDLGGTTFSLTAGIHGEYTWTNSTESAKESSEAHSEVTTDSREMTETAADGAIRTAIVLSNPGNTTFTLTGLGVLVSQRNLRRAEGDTSTNAPLKTITTMTPVFDTVTLAPGETAGPFELVATGVNAQAIKELLAAPDTLMLDTASMNFVDSSGLDFDYVRQFTVAQTAYIVIDFGDGEVRHYNVATNVDRNPDSTYRGIRMQRVMEEVLGLPFDDGVNGYTTMANPDPANDQQVLRSLRGREYTLRPDGGRQNYWLAITNNAEHTAADFNDMILRAGDYVHLMFSRDDDNDGLSNTLERAVGSDRGAPGPDADLDGLPDKLEAIDGWVAFQDPANPDAPHPDGFKKRRVYSSATLPDTDGDGLSDAAEFVWRSDPMDPDSDGDGLRDGADPNPVRRAGVRFVRADATPGGNGRTWDTAYTTIQRALLDAAANPHPDPADDVSQIWVASGTYKPAGRTSPITLVNSVGIYGGFSGPDPNTGFPGETKRGQRNTNPWSNGCILSGDQANPPNDSGSIDLQTPGTYNDNCPTIVLAPAGVTSATILNGFMITGAYAKTSDIPSGALYTTNASPTIENCLFLANGNQVGGAGAFAAAASSPVFRKCVFANNIANWGGGAYLFSSGQIVFEDCEFSQNQARRIGNQAHTLSAGGAVSTQAGRTDFIRCVFTSNSAWNRGGALEARGGYYPAQYVRVDRCRFTGNTLTNDQDHGNWNCTGAGIHMDMDGSISNSVFWDNRSRHICGGIAVINGTGHGTGGQRVAITNCTLSANRGVANSAGAGILVVGQGGGVTIENSIVWGNWYGFDPLPDDPNYQEFEQIWAEWGANVLVRNSCVNTGHAWRYRGVNNNINDDPKFHDLELGDLRIGNDSPCVDRGSSFVDLDPLVPGLQPMPEFDLFGKPRLVDGNNDGIIAVDMGAFEAAGPQR